MGSRRPCLEVGWEEGKDRGRMGRGNGGGEEKRGREMMAFWQKEKVRYFHFRIVKISHFCCATVFFLR